MPPATTDSEKRYTKALLTKVVRTDDGRKVFRFRATNGETDRQNEQVDPKGWSTDAFMANPVFLWAHQYDQPPIGKVVNVENDDDGLLADVEFDQEDEFARKIQSKYERGILSAVSVGFISKEMEFDPKGNRPLRHLKQELLELSGVPVPALASALMQRGLEATNRQAHPPHTSPMADMGMAWDASAEVGKAEGADELWRMHAWRDSEGDPAAKASYKLPHHLASGEVVWRGVAAAMAALMGARGGVQIPDADRRGVHSHLARHYAQFGKEPPEFKTLAELSAFGPEEVRGLFWEGELDELPVQKVGRKLSKATLERMRRVMGLMGQAMSGMQEMMDEMEGGTEDGEEGGDKGMGDPPEPEPEPEIDIDVDLEALCLKARAVQAATQGVK